MLEAHQPVAGSAPGAGNPGPAPGTSNACAQVRDLHVSFRRGGKVVRALRGVDISIAPGEIVGLVGESGSGKSVLGLSLLGLHTAATTQMSGSLEVLGHDMSDASPEVWRSLRRRYLGAVFQDPMTSLNPTMRVGRQVEEAAGSAAEAARLLRAVGIPDAEKRMSAFPHQLSGGLRQRVMIAMAVAGEPKLVVADEPTTALDVTVQAQILSLLRRLRDEVGMAMLFITHDLGVASQVADRVAVLYGGQMMEMGPAATMLGSPSHPYTQGLLRSRLTLNADRERPIRAMAGEPPDPASPPAGCPFSPRCRHAGPECAGTQPSLVQTAGTLSACWHPQVGPREEAGATKAPAWAETGRKKGLALLANGVTKRFTSRKGLQVVSIPALRGVDLEIAEGEAVALVGESGSGKSTLLRAIGGLTGIDAGSVELGMPGRPQMVFQDAGASLTPWMTVGALVEERLQAAGVARKDRREAANRALSSVGLSLEVAKAKPRQLSGGQRQRVALARVIAVPPPLLLCDEPTSALDVSLAASVLNLIGDLRRSLDMAVLFVTHDLAVARVVADRVAVMYMGQIVETGPVQSVIGAPRHPYTAALLASVPDPGAKLPTPSGEPGSPLDLPSGCSFSPRCARASDGCLSAAPTLELPRPDDHAYACFNPLTGEDEPWL
ncbi:MAG TPA: ABC transporter ATP-binding protein [Acidimicrobiales bacterium]|nr:ABC transporter ATP-binding protein [Acidimicrobiales bacterium]